VGTAFAYQVGSVLPLVVVLRLQPRFHVLLTVGPVSDLSARRHLERRRRGVASR